LRRKNSIEPILTLKIPVSRVPVLIGKNGETKRKIESMAGVKIKVNSKTGEVKVYQERDTDPTIPLKIKSVIAAIARGFNPEKSLLLLNDDYALRIIDLRQYGKTKNALKRIRGRIIGSEGSARQFIEEETGAYISVYGHTVAIIGRLEDIIPAVQAIEMLASGSKHITVYRTLKRLKE